MCRSLKEIMMLKFLEFCTDLAETSEIIQRGIHSLIFLKKSNF